MGTFDGREINIDGHDGFRGFSNGDACQREGSHVENCPRTSRNGSGDTIIAEIRNEEKKRKDHPVPGDELGAGLEPSSRNMPPNSFAAVM